MLLFVLMALFAKIPHRLKTSLKAVLCIAAVSLALLLINAYHNKPVGILKYNVTAEIQRHGVAYHVDKRHAMTACGDNTFISPSGCLPCPNGTFSFPGWTECKPFLDCSEIAREVHLKQSNAFRGVTKKKWMAEWEGHEVVYMKCACKRCQERCLRGMTRMEMFQGPFVTSLIGRCYDKLEIVTMYYKHGSGKYLNGYLKKPGVYQYNNLKTRFQLVVDYVKVMNYLHNSPVGAIVMCDTANIVKALSQYLITDDFHLVVNDLDNTPLVADTDGILCSHRRAKESNSWFSPEQRGLSDSDSVPKTDEKIEIWRIPAVMKMLLDGVEGSSFVKSKLDKVMTRCQATNPQQRPTANEVVQELLRVQQLIT